MTRPSKLASPGSRAGRAARDFVQATRALAERMSTASGARARIEPSDQDIDFTADRLRPGTFIPAGLSVLHPNITWPSIGAALGGALGLCRWSVRAREAGEMHAGFGLVGAVMGAGIAYAVRNIPDTVVLRAKRLVAAAFIAVFHDLLGFGGPPSSSRA